MRWNDHTPSERLKVWREFRETVGVLSTPDAIETVLYFFSTVPFGNATIDVRDSKNWPTPWELVESNVHCHSSISLMIYHTLKMASDKFDVGLKLVLHDDQLKLSVTESDSLINQPWCGTTSITVVKTFCNTQVKQFS